MPEYIKALFAALPEAAKSPFAFVGYVAAAIIGAVVVIKIGGLTALLFKIKDFREEDRLKALKVEKGVIDIRGGITAEQWIRAQRNKYFFYAFAIVCAVIVMLFVIATTTKTQPVSSTSLGTPVILDDPAKHKPISAPSALGVNKFEQYSSATLKRLVFPEAEIAKQDSLLWSNFLTQMSNDIADRARDLKVQNPDGTYRLHTDKEMKRIREHLTPDQARENKDRQKQYKPVANDMCDMMTVILQRMDATDRKNLTLKDPNMASCARVRAGTYTATDLYVIEEDLKTASGELF